MIETLQRRVVPRLVVAQSTIDFHRRAAATLRRRLGGSATVRLFIAFDDPYSAVALVELADRVAGRRANLLVVPVVARGIPDDPAADAKRRYAVGDADRIARRYGRALTRSEPLAAEECAALAAQAAAITDVAERAAFCVAAVQRLWFGAAEPGALPAATEPGAVRRNEREFRRRRLYDTPAAVVHGRWYFAHERLAQIEQRLDDLGWTRSP